MANQNLEMLRAAVGRLKSLADELVFVGGCTTGLLITDEAAAEIRPTDDVDSIVEATTYVEYVNFTDRLRKAGFVQDASEDAPMCRWVNQETILDVMPLNEKILGFTNKWYAEAIVEPHLCAISPHLYIKVLTPPFFCATKLEAFAGRGNSEYLSSHDLEDLITVIDGRQEIVSEICSSKDHIRSYIATRIKDLLNSSGFIDALPGHLLPDAASQERLPILIDRLNRISEC